MKMKKTLILVAMLFAFGISNAQTIRSSSYSTIGSILDEGTVRNSSHSIVGYIQKDGTIRNSSHSIIGYAKGVKKEWAAVLFFFFIFN